MAQVLDLGSVIGPQGPKGATGERGPQGPTGAKVQMVQHGLQEQQHHLLKEKLEIFI